ETRSPISDKCLHFDADCCMARHGLAPLVSSFARLPLDSITIEAHCCICKPFTRQTAIRAEHCTALGNANGGAGWWWWPVVAIEVTLPPLTPTVKLSTSPEVFREVTVKLTYTI